MKKNNAGNVTAGKPKVGGAVFRAPLGTPLPSDATSPLDAGFVCMGYVSEDGVSNGYSKDSSKVKAWGGDTVLNVNGGTEDTFSFSMIEALNAGVLGAVYNSENVTGDLETGMKISVTSEDSESASWVFEIAMKDKTMKRIVVPSASISEVEDITYNDTDPVGYGVTLAAVPVNGATHIEYIKRSAK